MKIQNVHSVRYRIKDAEHLVEKIIRKKLKDTSSDITIENYKEKITDLIGLRALHLFKEDWELINTFLVKTYNFKETPTANYRKGDSEELINFYTEKGCEVNEHEFGYRSVHYIVETQPAKQKYFIEIQVRTIFEEAWAEIDHTIRYPYDLENPIYLQFLLILNRLSGSADEMGSFVQFLKRDLDSQNQNFKLIIEEKESIILDMERKIADLGLEGEKVKALEEDLKKLKLQKYTSPFEELINGQKNWQDSDSLPIAIRAARLFQQLPIQNDSLKAARLFQELTVQNDTLINSYKNLNSISSLNPLIQKFSEYNKKKETDK